MKRLLAILFACFVALTLVGCSEQNEPEETTRFTVEYAETDGGTYPVEIITDNQTGVQYIFYKEYRAGGLCKLEE